MHDGVVVGGVERDVIDRARAAGRVRASTLETEARGVRQVRRALGDVQARRGARVQPEAGELERRPRPDLQSDDGRVELAAGVDVVAEHQHVLHLGDAHAGWAPAGCARGRAVRGAGTSIQVGGVEQLGLVAQLLRAPGEAHHAALHHVRAVREAERDGRELLDQQHADPRLGDRADRRDQPLDHDRREAERQLVDDHEPRLGHERLREHDHLLLAARQRAGGVAQALLELGEQLERARAPGRGLLARQRIRRDPDVVLDGQLAEQPAAFRDDREPGLPDPLGPAARELAARRASPSRPAA